MSSHGFTETTISDIVPREKQFTVWDPALAGFGVRVSPGGTKTFVFVYRLKGSRIQRWKTLGRAGEIPLEEARRLARIDTGRVAAREDPLAPTDAARAAFTLKWVAERYLADHLSRRKPSTQRSYRQTLEKILIPKLGHRPVADIHQGDVIALHEALRKTPTYSNRVIRTLSSLLSWSMRGNGRYRPIGPNPCYKIEFYPERKVKRYLTDAEYAKVGGALQFAALSPGVKTALRLLVLTGARPLEIASLRWSAVDLPGRVLNLTDSKTGEKQIYLAPEAVTILQQWPRQVSPYVFPGTARNKRGIHLHPSTLTHAWADLRTTIGLDDVRLYDARHSYASTAASKLGLTLPQIGAQLGHTQASTTQRYAHLIKSVALEHAAQVGGAIAAAMKSRRRRS